MPIRVFISHNHEDHTLSEALAALLIDTLGLHDEDILNTSQATTALRPGSSVAEGLRQAMDSAEVCLVLITPASSERPFVQFETGGAYFGNKPLYPLLHPSAKSPYTLPNNPTRIDNDGDIAKLIDALRDDLKVDAKASTAKIIQAVSRFIGEVNAYNPEYTILHWETRLELQIGYGDVLEWPGPGAIALPCDNRFDVVKRGEGSQLYERTLIGQFRSRFLDHLSTEDFRKHMVQRLGGSNLDEKFKIGHVRATSLVEGVTAARDARRLFLVVLFSVMDRNGVVEGAADALDVWCAYESLWKAVSSERPEAVAVPLLGAGQSGTSLTRQQSCSLAVLSAVCVALRNPIYPRLRLLCRNRESYRALNLRAIAEAAGLERGPRA